MLWANHGAKMDFVDSLLKLGGWRTIEAIRAYLAAKERKGLLVGQWELFLTIMSDAVLALMDTIS